MADIAKQDKPFELDRFEFGLFVVVWKMWTERHPDLLQAPRVKAFDERVAKHWADGYRSEVF